MPWVIINSGGRMPMSKRGIDTNILIYALDKESDFNQQALRILMLLGESKAGVVCWQNLTEFYAIVTDKKRIKIPLPPRIAVRELNILLNKFSLEVVSPNLKTKELWFDLLKTKDVRGQIVHDIFLAATLLSNGVNTLITENAGDFKGVVGLKTVTLKENSCFRGE